MIHVIAPITVADGQRDAFLQAFGELVPKVRAEDGCIEYGPTIDVAADFLPQSAARENVVTVVEKWENLDALQAHLSAPHMVEFRERVKQIVQAIDLQVLQPA